MTKESTYLYKLLNQSKVKVNKKMPSNTDPEVQLVIMSPELPTLSKPPRLKVSFECNRKLKILIGLF